MMRLVLLAAGLAFAVPLFAQNVAPKKPNALESPLPLAPEPEVPVVESPTPIVTETITIPPEQATPKFWLRVEFLSNVTKQAPLIPLVTANGNGNGLALGSRGATVLFGPGDMPYRTGDGLRATVGAAIPNVPNLGVEFSYFFADTSRQDDTTKVRTNPSASTSNTDLFTAPFLGVPIIDSGNRAEAALLLRTPFRYGAMNIETSTMVQGAEALAVWNFLDDVGDGGRKFRMYGLAGYRFVSLNETLQIEADPFLTTTGPNASTFAAHTVDRVETSNQFHGGLVGLRLFAQRGTFFFEIDGKVSVGSVHQTMNRYGYTAGTLIQGNAVSNIYSASGLYVPAQNAGRTERSVAALLPEGVFRIGLAKDRGRFFVGYNLLYLGDVLRPGDQLERTIDPVAFANGASTKLPSSTNYWTTDFWMQGVTVGFEFRY